MFWKETNSFLWPKTKRYRLMFPKEILTIIWQIRDPNLILDQRTLHQVLNSMWKFQLLGRLTERNNGLILGGISVCSALGGPTTLKIRCFGGQKVPPLRSRPRLTFWANHCFPLGLVITWDIHTNRVLPIFLLLLPFSLILSPIRSCFRRARCFT